MKMTFAIEAGGSKPNEDWTGASDDTMVVLDGVTVPEGIETGCVHGTPWYVDALGSLILEHSDKRSGMHLGQVLSAAISAVNAQHEKTCDIDAPGTPAATVAIFRASPGGCDYLVLSDAFLVTEAADGDVQVVTDRTLESIAVRERSAVYDLKIGTPEHTAAVLSMVRVQMALRNRPGGYWVAAADPSAAEHALTGHFGSGDVARAAVLTDGAARLVEPFEVLSWPQLMALLAAGSGRDLISRTRSVERDDPRGHKWPRYKTSDDAAVAYCDLTAGCVSRAGRHPQPSVSFAS
jgi:hypothetical protein